MRNDTVSAIDKWAEAAGAETIINYAVPLLTQENPELRTETLNWTLKNKEGLALADHSTLVKPLMMCLLDKNPSIRNSTELLIVVVIQYTGYQPF